MAITAILPEAEFKPAGSFIQKIKIINHHLDENGIKEEIFLFPLITLG